MKSFEITLGCLPFLRKFGVFLKGETDFDLLDLLPYRFILLCPLHLSFQSDDLSLHLGNDVLNPEEILLSRLHLHQG